MQQKRIEEIVLTYFPKDEFSDEQRRFARLACENVERETRQEAVSAAYDLANMLAKTPREHDASKPLSTEQWLAENGNKFIG